MYFLKRGLQRGTERGVCLTGTEDRLRSGPLSNPHPLRDVAFFLFVCLFIILAAALRSIYPSLFSLSAGISLHLGFSKALIGRKSR